MLRSCSQSEGCSCCHGPCLSPGARSAPSPLSGLPWPLPTLPGPPWALLNLRGFPQPPAHLSGVPKAPAQPLGIPSAPCPSSRGLPRPLPTLPGAPFAPVHPSRAPMASAHPPGAPWPPVSELVSAQNPPQGLFLKGPDLNSILYKQWESLTCRPERPIPLPLTLAQAFFGPLEGAYQIMTAKNEDKNLNQRKIEPAKLLPCSPCGPGPAVPVVPALQSLWPRPCLAAPQGCAAPLTPRTPSAGLMLQCSGGRHHHFL